MSTLATLMEGMAASTFATIGRTLVISALAAAITTITFTQDMGSSCSTISVDDTRCAITIVAIGAHKDTIGIENVGVFGMTAGALMAADVNIQTV